MKAKHLIPLALTALLVSPLLWADNLDPNPNPAQLWSQAEGMQVYTMPDGRIHAEINYQEQNSSNSGDNTKHKFTFEGTQSEIREQVQKNTTLPEDKKKALLQSLSMNMDPSSMLNEQQLFGQMFGGSNPFDDPFFKNDAFFKTGPLVEEFFKNTPFNDDVFKNMFKNVPPAFAPPPGFGQIPQPVIPPAPVAPATPPTGGGNTSSSSSNVLL